MVMDKIRPWVVASLLAATTIGAAKSADAAVYNLLPLHRYVVGGAVAEIIDSSPDGNTLVFTNAGDRLIGFVDITDPANPQPLGSVEVDGEPTSVAVTPNGQYAIAAVLDLIDEDAGETIADQQPGKLVFIDMATQAIVGEVALPGIGPDSVAITSDGTKIVVAIEDEEDTDNLPGTRAGSVAIATINYDDPSQSSVASVAIDLTNVEGANYVTDPQPEFVAISPDDQRVAVTLQENNAIALIDLNTAEVINMFSAGTSTHEFADLTEDGEIRLTEPFEGRREPDAIAFTPDGQHLVTVNEGDTDVESFGDGIQSGGRGWSIFDLDGNVVYDSGSSLEQLAVMRGQYPDDRSESRGIEAEGGTVAEFNGEPIAFIASERGSFVAAYNISDVTAPQLIDLRGTGLSPEGVLAIPSRNLLVTANETDGTIDFFDVSSDATARPFSDTEPLVTSIRPDLPFSAISGLVQSPDYAGVLYAVPDNAIAPSRIFTINLNTVGENEAIATVVDALTITRDGEPASYDLEGIALNPEGGFWLVSEGDDREGQESPNLLIQVNGQGEVEQEIALPEADADAITRYGFEGVATSEDGSKLYMAVQREFEGDAENVVRIAEYDVANGSWSYYYYPLDTDQVEDSWVGLSDIARDVDGSFLIVERDNQGGENGAANIRNKRIYRVNLADAEPGSTLEKTLVVDLFEQYNWLEDKVESIAVTEAGYWLASDNDGGISATHVLFIPRE